MTRCAECIVNDVARAFDVLPGDIVGQFRDRRVAYPRFAAYRLMRDKGLSVTVIGRMIGRRDHSTVSKGLVMADKLLRTNAEFAAAYEDSRG